MERVLAGHSALAAVAFVPVGSYRITPEASEQKLRCPVVPVVDRLRRHNIPVRKACVRATCRLGCIASRARLNRE